MNPAEIQELMLHLRNITESLDKISEALQPKTIKVDPKNAVTDIRNVPTTWARLEDVPPGVEVVEDVEGDVLIRVGGDDWRYGWWTSYDGADAHYFRVHGPFTRV